MNGVVISGNERKMILHNGIVLPEEWPPQYPKQLFLERQVIPFPYLENRRSSDPPVFHLIPNRAK